MIAYYKRKDTVDGKDVEKEFVIGQVNILATEHYKNILTEEDHANTDDFKIPLKSMPIHFVKVKLKKVKQESDLKFKETDSGKNVNLPSSETDMVKKINEYFKQTGIAFQHVGPQASVIEASIIKFKNTSNIDQHVAGKTALYVAGQGFIMDGNYLKETSVGTTPEVRLIDKLIIAFKKHLINNVLYDKASAHKTLLLGGDKDLSIRHYTMPDGLTFPASQQLKDFLETYTYLCPKQIQEGFFRDKEVYPPKLLWERIDGIAEYISKNTNLIFLLEDIPSERKDNKRNTAAYAMLGINGVVMFKEGMDKWEETLPHELGHALGLEHSFNQSYPLLPTRVNYYSESDWTKIRQFNPAKGHDCDAYAATYNNLMDYEDEKNKQFKRNTFTKWQWDKMIGNIKVKSYRSTIVRGHSDNFSNNNPYLSGTNSEIRITDDEKKQFIDDLNNLF